MNRTASAAAHRAVSYVTVILFLLLLTAGGVLLFLLPKQDFSPGENRVLTLLPEISVETVLDGSFQEKFGDFTTDQFPLRDTFTAAGSLFKYSLGKRDIGGGYIGKNKGDGVRLFEKTDTLSHEGAKKTLSELKELSALLTEKDPSLRSALLLVPSSGTVYEDALPAFAQVFDGETLIAEAKNILSDSPCQAADPLPALRRTVDDPIAAGAFSSYYRTDHHWTTAGASVAYPICCDALGITPGEAPLSYKWVADGFYGTLASKVQLPFVTPDDILRPDTDVSGVHVYIGSGFAGETLREIPLYHEDALEKKDKYLYFLGGNYGFALLENETLPEDGGTLLLLKDSFANCFVPYLTAHYRRIVMIDPRYYRGNLASQIEEYAPDNLLVLYECDNFAKDTQLSYLLKRTVAANAQAQAKQGQ